MKLPIFEVWEYRGELASRIAMCGHEGDARMMMSLAPFGATRSWIRCENPEHLYCTEGDK